jgi:hypothetical protein
VILDELPSDEIIMSAASRYWTLIRIDAAGKRKIEPIESAKVFFLDSFGECIPTREVSDSLIQSQLLHWMKEAEATEQYTYAQPRVGNGGSCERSNRRFLAELCLMCFVSSQILRVCQQLEERFGIVHGFTCSDLLRCVLDEDNYKTSRNKTHSSYQSLPQEILQSFNPQQSSLATWTTRLVKHHRELNDFLLEHGVYLVSDWAILNDTNSKQLQRIFSQFHSLTAHEIRQAQQLLEAYHAIYRAGRRRQLQQGNKGRCLPPTTEQLQQIAERLSTSTPERFHLEALMARLQDMASHLREYRIYVRSGSLPTESIDTPVTSRPSGDRYLLRDFIDERNTNDEQSEFLDAYRQLFINCLDQAIAQVTEAQVAKLQRKDSQKAEKFLTALQLFHCRGLSMGEIAPHIDLQAQYHVSRLLKLKSLRSDIQHQFLGLLRDRVTHEAKTYTNPERLQALSKQIEEALDEQVTQVVNEAATEASTATGTKHRIPTSLFAQRLCRYLDTRRSNHV